MSARACWKHNFSKSSTLLPLHPGILLILRRVFACNPFWLAIGLHTYFLFVWLENSIATVLLESKVRSVSCPNVIGFCKLNLASVPCPLCLCLLLFHFHHQQKALQIPRFNLIFFLLHEMRQSTILLCMHLLGRSSYWLWLQIQNFHMWSVGSYVLIVHS